MPIGSSIEPWATSSCSWLHSRMVFRISASLSSASIHSTSSAGRHDVRNRSVADVEDAFDQLLLHLVEKAGLLAFRDKKLEFLRGMKEDSPVPACRPKARSTMLPMPFRAKIAG